MACAGVSRRLTGPPRSWVPRYLASYENALA